MSFNGSPLAMDASKEAMYAICRVWVLQKLRRYIMTKVSAVNSSEAQEMWRNRLLQSAELQAVVNAQGGPDGFGTEQVAQMHEGGALQGLNNPVKDVETRLGAENHVLDIIDSCFEYDTEVDTRCENMATESANYTTIGVETMENLGLVPSGVCGLCGNVEENASFFCTNWHSCNAIICLPCLDLNGCANLQGWMCLDCVESRSTPNDHSVMAEDLNSVFLT